MLHGLVNRPGPIGRSSSALAHPSHVIGRRIGQTSTVLTLSCLLLFGPASLVLRAEACPAGHGCSGPHNVTSHGAPSQTGHPPGPIEAQQGGQQGVSTTSLPATHQAPDPASHPASHAASHATGSTGPGHDRPGAGHDHPRNHASSQGRRHPGRARHPVPRRVAIVSTYLPAGVERAVRTARTEHVPGVPEAIFSLRSSRTTMPDHPIAAPTLGQVAKALRFPGVLLGMILLFLGFQQRADRRDPKLANAPLGSRQETLEFR